MPHLRDVFAGPWRAVLVLGVTQILAWGAIFYPPVLTVPLIAAERGWSMTFAMGGFSLALLTAGLASPRVGLLIDRHGGHRVMSVGSLLGALGLVLIVLADHPVAYLAVWMLLGVAIAASLYDPAFATLGRIFGAAARRPITALTLAGGFASTVSWPTTHVLLEAVGWRGTYLVYAGLLACVAAPLHAFALPRTRADPVAPAGGPVQVPTVVLPPKGWPFVLVAAAFAAYAFVPSGMSAHLLAIFGRAGIDAATVVAIGALFGPAQVAARICELSICPPHPPAQRRALRHRNAAGGIRAARAVRAHGGERRDLRHHVRNGEWSHHHRARRRAPDAVRGRQAMDISWGGSGARSWRCRRSRRWRSPSSRNGRPIRWCSRWSRASRPWPFVAFIAIRPPKAAR
jgi:MFS family permease